ncbi:MAG: alpha/beta hydrolase [Chitinophagaceae bacterium]|nr:alpha/beta hydrolase [Chitinophagaceae bacterium]
MVSKTKLVFAAAIIALGAACSSQVKTPQNIPSPVIHFVPVEKNVQLEVIDWGGAGQSIVLLAGGGNTAHVFDDFAPKLARYFHVYGITRRGFGASQFSPVDDKSRLAKDILVVLDSMNIHNPVLAGHSIAGVELSEIARVSQNGVSGLVYLEAGYPYAFSNSQSPGMNEFFELKGPPQPLPEQKDLTSFRALQNWNTKTYGFQLPESEYRQTWDSTAESKTLRRRDSPGFAIFPTMLNNSGKNDNIPLSSLVIFAIPHS